MVVPERQQEPPMEFQLVGCPQFVSVFEKGGSTGRCRMVGSAGELLLGDVICYDWEGDGRFNHNTIVTAYDADGQPLVNAHTQNSLHRRWEYRDSPAWTPQTRYVFFRIE